MTRIIQLNEEEATELLQQDPESSGRGGFQSLLVKLQRQLDRNTNELELHDSDLERIPRYAFEYRNGGWQSRLIKIFRRTLGSQLKN